MKIYFWQQFYQEAMLEVNDTELRGKLNRAVLELRKRSRQLMFAQDEESRTEYQAITDALNGLSAIERYELCSPLEPGFSHPPESLRKECR